MPAQLFRRGRRQVLSLLRIRTFSIGNAFTLTQGSRSIFERLEVQDKLLRKRVLVLFIMSLLAIPFAFAEVRSVWLGDEFAQLISPLV